MVSALQGVTHLPGAFVISAMSGIESNAVQTQRSEHQGRSLQYVFVPDADSWRKAFDSDKNAHERHEFLNSMLPEFRCARRSRTKICALVHKPTVTRLVLGVVRGLLDREAIDMQSVGICLVSPANGEIHNLETLEQLITQLKLTSIRTFEGREAIDSFLNGTALGH